ncbi:MAG: D-alanyl-D-alanine carboxypeptidase family protein [Patescibacteria group bacterium]
MHVVEPQQFKQLKKRKSPRSSLKVVLLVLILTGLGGSYWWFELRTPSSVEISDKPTNNLSDSTQQTNTPQKLNNSNRQLRQLSDTDFKQLFLSIGYPNVQPISDSLPITGNEQADLRIRNMAEKRGYRRGSVPVASIQKTQEAGLMGDDLLQPLALDAWQAMRDTAKRESIPLKLNSAYRSVDYQRNLFLNRLYDRGATISKIAAGQSDGAVVGTLVITAPPGYSRHHSGYTIDLWCEDGSLSFVASSCFTWIKNNNYEKAKIHGWIPSYPEEAEYQGPEPEAWEYVWVGVEVLYQ